MRHGTVYHVEGISNQGQARDVVADAKLDDEEDGVERHHDADPRRLGPTVHRGGCRQSATIKGKAADVQISRKKMRSPLAGSVQRSSIAG